MMKKVFRSHYVMALILLLMVGCAPPSGEKNSFLERGYVQEDGQLYYFSQNSEGQLLTNHRLLAVDKDSFQIIDQDFGKDKNRAYYQGRVIVGADPKTFQPLGFGFSRDQSKIFQENATIDRLGQLMDTQNLLFRPYDVEAVTAVQKKFLRYKDRDFFVKSGWAEPVAIEDRATFEIIDDFFARDSKRVYSIESAFRPLKDLDPKTFQSFGNEHFVKDKDGIYKRNQNDYRKFERLNVPHPQEIKKISLFHNDVYFTDQKNAYIFYYNSFAETAGYHSMETIENVDVESFVLLKKPYAKDKNFVYFKGERMRGVHPAFFKVPEDT